MILWLVTEKLMVYTLACYVIQLHKSNKLI